MICRALPSLENDERIKKILTNFDKRYTGTDYSNKKTNGDAITPDMLDDVSSIFLQSFFR